MKRHVLTLSRNLLVVFVILMVFACISFAGDSSVQVIHRFQGPDGANPYGNLIWDQAGNLYGTTEYMGTSFYGTVFQLAPPANVDDPWTLTTLHSFKDHGDGARPTDGLLLDKQGNLYGTTSDSDAGGYGEIFELSPPAVRGGAWTETVLHHFRGETDGAYPQGGLISDEQGNLYGATGTSVFEMSPPALAGEAWTFILLHHFHSEGADGWSAQAGLVRDGAGNLYGSTIWGGYEGNLYGTTMLGGDSCYIFGEFYGCGTAYKLSPEDKSGTVWNESVLYFFQPGPGNARQSAASLLFDNFGNLYGTTVYGGDDEKGTIFRIVP